MRSTHHRATTATGLWAHLNELPQEIREVLAAEIREAEESEQAMMAAAVAAMRQASLAKRVPKMCDQLLKAQPGLRKRKVFSAVALVTGISEGHVRDLFYKGKKP